MSSPSTCLVSDIVRYVKFKRCSVTLLHVLEASICVLPRKCVSVEFYLAVQLMMVTFSCRRWSPVGQGSQVVLQCSWVQQTWVNARWYIAWRWWCKRSVEETSRTCVQWKSISHKAGTGLKLETPNPSKRPVGEVWRGSSLSGTIPERSNPWKTWKGSMEQEVTIELLHANIQIFWYF